MVSAATEDDCEASLAQHPCEDGQQVLMQEEEEHGQLVLGSSNAASSRKSVAWRAAQATAAASLALGLCVCGALATRSHVSSLVPSQGGLINMALSVQSWAGAGKCGIATNMLDHNEKAMNTFCSMDLDFWWNWAPVPRNTYAAACARPKFVPMIWGSGHDNKWIAQKVGKSFPFLMGYNEPDLWGPPPHPGDNYLSSGTFSPTFHCGSSALGQEWRDMVMYFKETSPGGTIISPAMADPSHFASTGSDAEACDTSPQTWHNHKPWCLGWLKCFKESVIKLDCGGGLNCWDAIDVLQFHAYEYDAESLISKVKRWEATWADELQGLNGRRKKTLWLTEFARAGTTDFNDPDGKAAAFMEGSVEYLKSSPYVSGWSWFSQKFSSFKINDIEPESPYWSSQLIDKDGSETILGKKYQELCSEIPAWPVAPE